MLPFLQVLGTYGLTNALRVSYARFSPEPLESIRRRPRSGNSAATVDEMMLSATALSTNL